MESLLSYRSMGKEFSILVLASLLLTGFTPGGASTAHAIIARTVGVFQLGVGSSCGEPAAQGTTLPV